MNKTEYESGFQVILKNCEEDVNEKKDKDEEIVEKVVGKKNDNEKKVPKKIAAKKNIEKDQQKKVEKKN